MALTGFPAQLRVVLGPWWNGPFSPPTPGQAPEIPAGLTSGTEFILTGFNTLFSFGAGNRYTFESWSYTEDGTNIPSITNRFKLLMYRRDDTLGVLIGRGVELLILASVTNWGGGYYYNYNWFVHQATPYGTPNADDYQFGDLFGETLGYFQYGAPATGHDYIGDFFTVVEEYSGLSDVTISASPINLNLDLINYSSVSPQFVKDFIQGRLINLTNFLPDVVKRGSLFTLTQEFENYLNYSLYSGNVQSTSAVDIN